MDYDHFAIDDGLTRNIERASNNREPFSPVQSVAGVDLLPPTIYVNLHAVAVVLDLMEPLVALGRFGLQDGELGLNEPRHLDTLWHSGNSQEPAAPWGAMASILLT